MKSFFFGNKARTPTASSFNRLTHSSPICQYFDNSPIVKQAKNEHMTFSRFAGIKDESERDKLVFEEEPGESKVIDNEEETYKEEDTNQMEFNRFDFFAERNNENTTVPSHKSSGNEFSFSSFARANNDNLSNRSFNEDNNIYSNTSLFRKNKSSNNVNQFDNNSYQEYPFINVNININNSTQNNNNCNFIYQNAMNRNAQMNQSLHGYSQSFSNFSFQNKPMNYQKNYYQENPMCYYNPQPQSKFFNMQQNYGQMMNEQFLPKHTNTFSYGQREILSKSAIKKITNQNYTTLNDDELAKQAHIIAKYQSGCRYLQKKLEENPELAQSLYYPNILEYIQELATDQFGNFYIKKLFQFLSEEKLLQLIAILFPILPAVGANQYGARVLQDLIDFLNTEKLINSFIKILIPHIDVFITDQNGSHVIYKILSLSDYQSSIVLFFEHILTKIGEIASSKKGCTFIQKCLETLNEEKLIMLIKAITANLFSIITNKYGNYIIQSVLTIDNFEYKKGIYEEILKNVCFYSNQKYSSNVMEKCFLEKEVCERMIDEVSKKEIFEQMLLDNFGNYVIQKAITAASDEKRNNLFNLLVPLIPEVQKKPYGQKLLSKLFIQYPKLAMIMLNLPQQ